MIFRRKKKMEENKPIPKQEPKPDNIYLLEINNEQDCLVKTAILAPSPTGALKKFLITNPTIDIQATGLSIDIDQIELIQ